MSESTPSIDVGDQLECAICCDQLWEPKLLNCGHTFCLKCLEELFDPEACPANPVVACPLCRKKTPVPKTGIAGLNSNFALQSLLEALSPLKPKSTVDVTKREDGETTMCEVHKEMKKFYCSTCEVLICRDCTVVDHPRPEHKGMNLDEAYTWRRQLNERELQLAMRVVKLAKRSKGILESTEADLNQRCGQVIAEIEKCREAGLEVLQEKAEAIEAFQVDLEAEIRRLHDLTEDASKIEVLDQSKGLIESMASLREQQSEILDEPEQIQYPVFMGTSEAIQGWPRLINLGGSNRGRYRKSKPKRQQSGGKGNKPEEGQKPTSSPPLMEQQTPTGYYDRKYSGEGQPREGQGGGRGQRGRGGYHHRGRGSADNRGRGGYSQRGGRGGGQGQRGDKGRGGGNQKGNLGEKGDLGGVSWVCP